MNEPYETPIRFEVPGQQSLYAEPVVCDGRCLTCSGCGSRDAGLRDDPAWRIFSEDV